MCEPADEDRSSRQCHATVDGSERCSHDRRQADLVAPGCYAIDSGQRRMVWSDGEAPSRTPAFACARAIKSRRSSTMIQEIMSQPQFVLGVSDARAGRRYRADYDLWTTNGQWK